MEKYTLISLFSGCGGMDLGFKPREVTGRIRFREPRGGGTRYGYPGEWACEGEPKGQPSRVDAGRALQRRVYDSTP